MGNGDSEANESVVSRLKALVVEEKYNEVIDECCKILESTETEKYDQDLAKSLRGTFYILKKQHEEAMDDFRDLIDDDSTDIKIRANALIQKMQTFSIIEDKLTYSQNKLMLPLQTLKKQ